MDISGELDAEFKKRALAAISQSYNPDRPQGLFVKVYLSFKKDFFDNKLLPGQRKEVYNHFAGLFVHILKQTGRPLNEESNFIQIYSKDPDGSRRPEWVTGTVLRDAAKHETRMTRGTPDP